MTMRIFCFGHLLVSAVLFCGQSAMAQAPIPMNAPIALSTSVPHFASLAYSASTGHWGGSWGWSDVSVAKDKSLDACRGPDCKLVGWVRNGYAAFAAGDQGLTGFAFGAFREDVIAQAVRNCAVITTSCEWKEWVYARDGSKSDTGRANFAGPQKVTLASIGGEFEAHLQNFVGFTQQETNWCWAAVTESIF
jgi:hypothetical protein